MRQILQSLKTGDIEIADVPCPAVKAGQVLIRTRVTLISAGTERMLLEFGKGSLLQKARQQPDKVRQVLQKVKTDGLAATLESVQSKLDEPLALGYCNVGTVLEVGAGVDGFAVGDRVVSNGKHAEVVCVPKNLCAKIPDGVSDEEAAFTVLAAIGLQGMRLAQPTLGESFAVSGLGLIGLLTVQLLRANGCRVLGLDFNAQRLELARSFGAETVDLSRGDPLAAAQAFSRGRGVDGVLVTAATSSDEPVHQAAQMCRRRGRIVLVGVAGLKLSRADFYEKELSFQVSCSYGPGRYDPVYEERGVDYPLGLVRWTEQRNFEAVLDMLAAKRLDPGPLVSHRFTLDAAADAYELITGSEPSLGVLLEYPQPSPETDVRLRQTTVALGGTATAEGHGKAATTSHATGTSPVPAASSGPTAKRSSDTRPRVAFIGAGNFAKQVLIPAFRRGGADLRRIAAQGGLSALLAGRKHEFAEATSDISNVLDAPDVDAVVIATRHDSHARLVVQALERGKHVFVEKPLALEEGQLADVEAAYQAAAARGNAPILTVGFNRRFAPHVVTMRSLLASTAEPKSFVMTVNAGAIPAEHWVHDPQAGGGRIIGEGCHFIDLLRFLCGCPIVCVQAVHFDPAKTSDSRNDQMTITLSFADGSFGSVHYFANGNKALPKERLEVFCSGRVLQLDNFRRLTGYGWKQFRRSRLWQMDKGHNAEAVAFLDAVRSGGPLPIPFDELVEVSRVTIDAVQAAETGEAMEYGRRGNHESHESDEFRINT